MSTTSAATRSAAGSRVARLLAPRGVEAGPRRRSAGQRPRAGQSARQGRGGASTGILTAIVEGTELEPGSSDARIGALDRRVRRRPPGAAQPCAGLARADPRGRPAAGSTIPPRSLLIGESGTSAPTFPRQAGRSCCPTPKYATVPGDHATAPRVPPVRRRAHRLPHRLEVARGDLVAPYESKSPRPAQPGRRVQVLEVGQITSPARGPLHRLQVASEQTRTLAPRISASTARDLSASKLGTPSSPCTTSRRPSRVSIAT